MHEKLVRGLDVLGVDLPQEIVKKEELFLQELLRWNKKINLTSIDKHSEAQEKHLLDSLVLLKYFEPKGYLLDMGSGAGMPGIPLAIACSQLQVTSVDSVGKKINFQKHIRRLFNLENLNPLCTRLENLTATKSYDFIVARALSDIASLIDFAEPLLVDGGRLLVMKGPEGRKEIDQFFDETKECALEFTEQHDYLLPFSHAERQFFILKKTIK